MCSASGAPLARAAPLTGAAPRFAVVALLAASSRLPVGARLCVSDDAPRRSRLPAGALALCGGRPPARLPSLRAVGPLPYFTGFAILGEVGSRPVRSVALRAGRSPRSAALRAGASVRSAGLRAGRPVRSAAFLVGRSPRSVVAPRAGRSVRSVVRRAGRSPRSDAPRAGRSLRSAVFRTGRSAHSPTLRAGRSPRSVVARPVRSAFSAALRPGRFVRSALGSPSAKPRLRVPGASPSLPAERGRSVSRGVRAFSPDGDRASWACAGRGARRTLSCPPCDTALAAALTRLPGAASRGFAPAPLRLGMAEAGAAALSRAPVLASLPEAAGCAPSQVRGVFRADGLPVRTGARLGDAGRGCLAVSLTRIKSHTAIARSNSVSTWICKRLSERPRPSNRNTSSTRSPSVLIRAAWTPTRCSASTRAIE